MWRDPRAVAVALSQHFGAEVFGFEMQSSVLLTRVFVVRDGRVVRDLLHAYDSGWSVVEGQAQPWERRAFAVPPKPGERDERLLLSDGGEILAALGVPGTWGPMRPLPQGPMASSDRWVLALLFGIPLLALVGIYLAACQP